MLTVLTIRPRPQKRTFRRPQPISRVISLPSGHYTLITATPDRRGRLDWREIARLAGPEAPYLLYPAGLIPPAGYGIHPFAGQALQQALMFQTALHLLQNVPGLARRRVVIDDPQALAGDYIPPLLPLAADLRVFTHSPDRYAPLVAAAMAEQGACLPLTGDPAVITEAALVIAPFGPTPGTPFPGGWVLSGVDGCRPRTLSGYLPAGADVYFPFLPAGCDSWQFLAGLYERSHIHSLGDVPPSTLFVQNRPLSLPEWEWHWTGLDIGLSV